MVAATEEVISTRPWPRSTIPGRARLARWTTAVTLTAISSRSSSSGMSLVKSPLTPIPALSATASSGRPPASTAAHSRSTPSWLDRSALTARTSTPFPDRLASAAASSSSSAVMITSNPFSTNSRASSSPIPLDAPVTSASFPIPAPRSRIGNHCGTPLPRPPRPITAHEAPVGPEGRRSGGGSPPRGSGAGGLRVEVDGRLWGFGRASHVDPAGGPWRFAVAHGLEPGAGQGVRGRAGRAAGAAQVRGWAVDDGYDGPITVALYVDGHFWLRVTPTRSGPTWSSRGWGRTGSPSPTPDGYLAPGVVHQATADPAGPFAVNLVTVELAPSRIDIALALDVLPGQETTSSMARRRGAVARSGSAPTAGPRRPTRWRPSASC